MGKGGTGFYHGSVWNWFVLLASMLGFARFGLISANPRVWKDAVTHNG
jgi:hypothetical protein